jgi:hypothetical protein
MDFTGKKARSGIPLDGVSMISVTPEVDAPIIKSTKYNTADI